MLTMTILPERMMFHVHYLVHDRQKVFILPEWSKDDQSCEQVPGPFRRYRRKPKRFRCFAMFAKYSSSKFRLFAFCEFVCGKR